MRILRTLAVPTAALLIFGAVAQAQYDWRSVSALVDRVHADLNHAYEGRHFNSGDRKRLDNAEKQLRDFAKKWEHGRFDKGELDDAISSIQHVLDNNHMERRDREPLDADVNQLRSLREAYDRHEIR